MPPLSEAKMAGAIRIVSGKTNLPEEVQASSIRQFKGLEKAVVILVEPSKSDNNYTELMYVGISRARNHLEILLKDGE